MNLAKQQAEDVESIATALIKKNLGTQIPTSWKAVPTTPSAVV
jgi:hypothetical protein